MADPVTLDMAKRQCSIHGSDATFDALLTMYIAPAVDFVENRSGQLLVQRSVTEAFSGFGSYLELSKRPVISVTGASYYDEAGTAQTLADTDLLPLIGVNPVRVYPASSWPSVKSNTPVTVTYLAGYTDEERPQGLIMAALLLIGHWFANREAVVIGEVSSELQLSVDALCMQKRPVFG